MGMNSNNAVLLHKNSCGGKLIRTIVDKPALKGKYEIYLCKKECGYVGRGARVDDPKYNIPKAKEKDAKEKKPKVERKTIVTPADKK